MQLVCEIKLSVLRCRATIGTSQAGKVCLVQLLHEKPSAALSSHRMGGFNVSSWLQLLLCIIWPWVELIFLSFKTDDKLELWMLFRERASVPLNVRKGQRQQEYHFIHPAIAQAKNRASNIYKCQMWETYELCFYFLWLLNIKSQTETSFPITNRPPSEKPGCTLQPWMQHPGQCSLFNCILIAASCCAWNMGSNRGNPGMFCDLKAAPHSWAGDCLWWWWWWASRKLSWSENKNEFLFNGSARFTVSRSLLQANSKKKKKKWKWEWRMKEWCCLLKKPVLCCRASETCHSEKQLLFGNGNLRFQLRSLCVSLSLLWGFLSF